MHSTDSQSEEQCYRDTSPDIVHPVLTPVKEETEGDKAGTDCDRSSANDVWQAQM
jgi:hypothetical protein